MRTRTVAGLLVPSLLLLASWAVQGRSSASGKPAREEPANAGKTTQIKVRVLEGIPSQFQARIEQQKRALSKVVPPSVGLAPRAMLNLTKRWTNGQTLKIAFKGGDANLHKRIADVVSEWTRYANLKFDFGVDPATGQYRRWTPTDAEFAAEIRVSFNQPGYFSLVARDSVDPQIARPGEASLNLEGFDKKLPSDWKGVALHEFGHAIGFEHEHQGPGSMCDFRFDDDPGYVAATDDFGQFVPDPAGRRPGLYTLLGGPPNNWPQAVVDHNLKDLPATSAYSGGAFDKLSIMKYFFEDYMFISGTASPCYTDSENVVISTLDKIGAARVYPRALDAIAADDQIRAKIFDVLSKAETLPATTKKHFNHLLDGLKH
ncbi:hypothetical protein [Paludisphaera borealis]|uniref:Peptidase metallopeptidase domain-containing protein n=1 Tax=Paludisphaera borealis TaxID=1387353 RepID=A0A1U7CS43_9BACT|nr:hypothetical protein [Paludisphaera borealis]APW61716.1 hypothetical protein BSF38_03243 [Paludisphaera borealis]